MDEGNTLEWAPSDELFDDDDVFLMPLADPVSLALIEFSLSLAEPVLLAAD